jgi:hypothetical protein
MPCEEYVRMENRQKTERSTWAQFTHPENAYLRSRAGIQTAKELAKVARARATAIGKQMHWHREYCAECKARS